MQAQAPDEAMVSEAMEEAVDRGLVTLGREAGGFGQLGQHHGPIGLDEGGEQLFQGTCASEASLAAALERLGEGITHRGDDTPTCATVAAISPESGKIPLCSRRGGSKSEALCKGKISWE